MNRNLTELIFILDRSGSMIGLEADTIGGYNSLMKKQKNEQGDDEYLFEAASLRKCTYDYSKICNYCGKCAGDPDVKPFGVFTYKGKGDAKE